MYRCMAINVQVYGSTSACKVHGNTVVVEAHVHNGTCSSSDIQKFLLQWLQCKDEKLKSGYNIDILWDNYQ